MQNDTISAIVAVGRNGAIGRAGTLLCHLPADLRRFKQLTMGHAIIMGRRTFESLPHGALPGRQNIVITRRADFRPEGVTVARNPDDALCAVDMPGEVFIIGGAQVYAAMFDVIDTIYLTRIHADFADADTFFPVISPTQWHEQDCEHHNADEQNPYDFDFVTLRRLHFAPF